jgi:hypothetical protein
MAIFGSTRDVLMFKGITYEFVENVASQQCGYYKVMLSDTPPNVYGEAMEKQYIGPVLLWTLIERGDYGSQDWNDQSTDIVRTVKFRFFKDHLIAANVIPEIGDVVMYNEMYYEVDNVNENQKIVGKDPSYSYSTGLDKFGGSFSMILDAHYTSPDRLNIQEQRI